MTLKSARSALTALVTQKPSRSALIALVVLAGLSGWLNARGNRWGEPFLFHCDEAETVGAALMRVLTDDEMAPPYTHPAMVSAIMAKQSVSWQVGDHSSKPDELRDILTRRAEFTYSTRVLYALMGGLLTFAIGVLAWLLGGPLAGVLAGVAGACCPLLISHAHMARPDITLGLFATGTCCGAVAFARWGRPWLLVPSVLFAGLAWVEKYPGFTATGPLIWVVFVHYWDRVRWRALLWAALVILAVVAAGILVILPEVVANFSEVIEEFARIASVMKDNKAEVGPEGQPGFDGLTRLGNFMFYAGRVYQFLGPVLLLALIGGAGTIVVRLARSRREAVRDPAVPIYLFALGAVGLLSLLSLHVEKWMVLYIPVMLALAVVSMLALIQRVSRRALRWGMSALLILSLVSFAVRGGWTWFMFSREDTRVAAYERYIARVPRALPEHMVSKERIERMATGKWVKERVLDPASREQPDFFFSEEFMTVLWGYWQRLEGTAGWDGDRYSGVSPTCFGTFSLTKGVLTNYLTEVDDSVDHIVFSSAMQDMVVPSRNPERAVFHTKITTTWRKIFELSTCPFHRLEGHENYQYSDWLPADLAVFRLPEMLSVATSDETCLVGPTLTGYARR